MSALTGALLQVFLLILLGVVLRRVLLRDETHRVGIERLVYYVLSPALLIRTLALAPLGSVPVGEVGAALAGAVVLMSLLCLALSRVLRVDGPAFTSVFQGATRWQTFIALAIASALYGETGVTLAAVAMIAMIPLLNILNVWTLARFASAGRPGPGQVALAIAQNPLIWGCAIGLALNAAVDGLPAPIDALLEAVGRPSLPLSLVVVGGGLHVERVLRPRAATLVATALKLVLMPAMAIGLGLAFGVRGTSLAVIACCAAVPTASNSYVLARQMGGDAALMAEILTVQTITAIVTMPVVLTLVA
jgi:predicted permease